MISPVLISNIKWGTYVLWCGTNLSFIPMIYFLSKSLSEINAEFNHLCLTLHPVPETLNATLEDISVLFEESATWIIGPGSRKRLARIVAAREAAELPSEKEIAHGSTEMTEDVDRK